MNKTIKQLETELIPLKKEQEELNKAIEHMEKDRRKVVKEITVLNNALDYEKTKDMIKSITYSGGLLRVGTSTYVVKPNRVERLVIEKQYHNNYKVILEYKPLESVRKEKIEYIGYNYEVAELLYNKLCNVLFKKGIQDDKLN